jgi:folate-dependent phosphoribosylglycinamide formyltransferase PurN
MKPLVTLDGRRARVGIFLSGGGSNARVLLGEHAARGADSPLDPVCLVTDNPGDPACGARAIGEEFGVPVVGLDIRAFYRERGCPRVSVRSGEGRRIRSAWTAELRRLLAPLAIDFGVFAGFEPLTNITADFPCVNVHPGDLTYLRDGRRYLVGLHTAPVERAILEGLEELRSSVIVATPFHGGGEDMDTGPLLGISPAVPVDLQGHGRDALAAVAAARPARRPPGGYGDLLEQVAAHNQNRLKEGGDWVVFPPVVFHVARERFAVGPAGAAVYFREEDGGVFRPVTRIEFGRNHVAPEFAA